MRRINQRLALAIAVATASTFAPMARADAVTDWNIRANDIIAEARINTPLANRVLAIFHTSIYEAANRISGRYPAVAFKGEAAAGASIDAAVAAAGRASLSDLLPAQQSAIDRAYQTAISSVSAGPERDAGISVGERAAAFVLAQRAMDGANVVESYRPHTTPGSYVPTTLPAVPQWPQRTPWLMTSQSQFRPGAPPALASEQWARDYNEVKSLGAKSGSTRTAEQTEIAKFWEATLPTIYHGVVRSVAEQPMRNVTQNARLFAAVTQAADDAVIAVFDAKYHYGFWRPITAIRNGDQDGNDATTRDPSWTPFIDTPMHPEYPCAHCIIAATVGTVVQYELGHGPTPKLQTASYTVDGATRSWTAIEDFIQEVSAARIYDGVHYRSSTEAGMAMGRQIGTLSATRHFGMP